MDKEELEKALLAQIPKVASGYPLNWRRKVENEVYEARLKAVEAKIKAEMLQEKRATETMGIKMPSGNPLIEIAAKYNILRKTLGTDSMLVCPSCGGEDAGNTLNKKPWCLKCNTPLVPKGTLKKWLPMVKVVPKSLKNDLKRLNPGLYPEENNDESDSGAT